MTSKEFVLWLKGFTEGVHQYNITPLQWDLVKDRLAEVKDEPSYNTHPPYVDGKGHPNPYYFTTTTNPIGLATFTTTANAEPTQTSERQLLTDNHD